MDRLSDQSVIANTEDLSRWCAMKADELDPLIATAEMRPLSPAECRTVLVTQRELLTRISQQQTLIAAMVFHRSSPWWVWVRAFLWGMRLRGKR